MKDQRVEPTTLGIVAAYFLFFILFLWPATDILSTILPFNWGSVQWRYGAVGFIGSLMATPILAIGFAMILAFLLRHRVFLRFASWICFAGVVFLILAMISLALDVVQLWQIQPAERAPSLKAGAFITEMKLFFGLISLALFGLAGWKSSRRVQEEKRPETSVVRPQAPALKSEKPREEAKEDE